MSRRQPSYRRGGYKKLPQYQDLAANAVVTISAERLPLWTQARGVAGEVPPPKLVSMSAALAQEYREDSIPELPGWMVPWIEVVRVDTESPYSHGDYGVDYSALDRLRSRAIRMNTAADLKHHDADLRCKIVLMGNGNFEELPPDSFKVPGREELVPGVFVHASGVYTLLTGPLYMPTGKGRLALDLAFSFLVITSVAVFSSHFRSVGVRRFQLLLTLCASLLAFLAGAFLVTASRLLWVDFLVVVLALWVHPLVEDEIVEFSSWIAGSLRRKRRDANPAEHREGRTK